MLDQANQLLAAEKFSRDQGYIGTAEALRKIRLTLANQHLREEDLQELFPALSNELNSKK